MTRGPTIVRMAPSGGAGARGIKCCCCRCCECINFGYLTTQHGLIKLAEAVSTMNIVKVVSITRTGILNLTLQFKLFVETKIDNVAQCDFQFNNQFQNPC